MKRAIVDLSSVTWTCLLAGKDTEFGREVLNEDTGKTVFVNGWMYGYENAINHLTSVMDDLSIVPSQMILVKEGMNSKAERQCLLATYKAGRDRLPQQYEQFQLCRDAVISAMLSVGAQMCWQDGGVEADDVIGYLALGLDGERWIVSADKDLAQVVGGDVHHLRMGAKDENPFGPFPHRLIPTYIALVGDSSDKIPGAKGFGPKAAEELLIRFGPEGLELMEDLILRKKLLCLEEDVGEMKSLQKIIDDAPNVYLSYELARLRLEKVNTVRRPLSWQAGMVKPRATVEDERLRKFGGVVKLIAPPVYAEALEWMKKQFRVSPWVALDVESSTPPESDEWLLLQGKDDGATVDVFGSYLTSVQLTFGRNMEFTVYLPIRNKVEEGVDNLTMDQIVEVLEQIPRTKLQLVHNASFELPVCYNAFGARWVNDPDYHGFLRNVIDTKIMSSYVDENRRAGLKGLSKELLGYEQVSYDEVTTKVMTREAWVDAGRPGRVLAEWQEVETVEKVDDDGQPITVETDGDDMVRVQLKMHELTAREVLSYGADDTICTAALANHFRIIMELERTWHVFMEVEQFPAYLTAKAFIDGADFSLEDMRAMEKEDDEAYDAAKPVLDTYLIKVGFDGTVCPVYTELTPANIKEAFATIAPGHELKTMVRTNSKLAKLIEQYGQENDIEVLGVLGAAVAVDDLSVVNDLVKRHFKGEPQLELGSPKQMTKLLYDVMKLPINIINDCTAVEKQKQPDLAKAVQKFKRKRAGKDLTMLPEEMALVRKKAKSDDTAIDYALAFDADVIADDAKAALKAIGTMKKVMTRRNLFYKNYRNILHWKDGKIHAQANQCAAVTRRYSMSGPNLQQLPKKGEGVKFRGGFKPHHRKAVVCSIDFSGQELRLAAERSQDRNMLACYVGDNLKDIHSITAAGAMRLKWGNAEVDAYIEEFGKDLPHGMPKEEFEYRLFLKLRGMGKAHPVGKKADDLRKDSKNVNFAAQFGGQAAKLSDTLIMPLADAQLFLDARSKMFPAVDEAAKRSEEECRARGYSLTLMGARRHLRQQIASEDSGEAARAARQSWNFEIQGSAGEMTKLSMTRLWKSDFLWKYDTRFIAPIHDELVTSIAIADAPEAIKVKHWCMVQPYSTMSVPVVGSISLGKDFAEQIECGDDFDLNAINDALMDVQGLKAAA